MGRMGLCCAGGRGMDFHGRFSFPNPITAVFYLVILLGLSISVQAANYYMSPTGSATGDGSINKPWDLYTAFNPGAVKPGDTIWARGGIYIPENPSWPSLECYLQGSSNAPIIVRAYPGERPIFQEHPQYNNTYDQTILFQQTGGYVWFWGIEIRSTNTARYASVTGSDPTYAQLPLPNSVDIEAVGDKLINMIIHDTRGGVGTFIGGSNCEVYGCLIYNNGWNAPDRGHGHGIYPQNLNGTKHLSDNIIFDQFGIGIHGYTQGSFLKHFLIERNVVFDNGCIANDPLSPNEQILFGNAPVEDLNLLNNYVYLPLTMNCTLLRLDYSGNSNDSVVVANNYVAGGSGGGNIAVSAQDYQSVIFTNNILCSTNGYLLEIQSKPGYIVDTNTYYGNSGANFNNNGTQYNFAGWQGAGFDAHSSYRVNTVPPNKVIVNQNAYEPKRANIIVYNWGNSNSASADVSSILSPGDTYEVHNAQDYFAPPVLAGTYTGAPLVLPMTNLTVAIPNGWTDTNSVPTTGKQFNVFLLLVPTTSSSQPFMITSITRTGSNINLVWNGSPGSNVVQASNGMPNGSYNTNFVNLATVVLSSAGVTNYTDVGGAANATRFYRVDLRQ